MKTLFHVHTEKSKCSNLKERELVDFLDKNGFDAVCVTDHNLLTKINWPNGIVIPGEEINTGEGDVIGLFLTSKIAPGLGMENTCGKIKEQGGLTIAAHPLDPFRGDAMGKKFLLKNLDKFDIIETFNSRNLLSFSDYKAGLIASGEHKSTIVGPDAHFLSELKNAYIEMKDFTDAKEFLANLASAKYYCKRAGLIPHFKTFFVKKFAKR